MLSQHHTKAIQLLDRLEAVKDEYEEQWDGEASELNPSYVRYSTANKTLDAAQAMYDIFADANKL